MAKNNINPNLLLHARGLWNLLLHARGLWNLLLHAMGLCDGNYITNFGF